jgi:NADH-quinone oxidoreductase subunit M
MPTLGVAYHVGIDGISLLLVLLTTFLMPLALVSAWGSVEDRFKEFIATMLLLETGMLGVFVSLDLFLFYVFWEAMLVPMYFIIGIWGGPNRVYAAVKFILYTMVGSALMLVAILALYYQYGAATGRYTFDVPVLAQYVMAPGLRAEPHVPRLRAGLRHQGAAVSRSTPGCPTPTSRRPPRVASSSPACS